ncbi:MAG: hypothetical protein IH950_01730 [Bacteroidetes bacterium]|nr:hypothetical protein [Bacteroidota bacterium]
MDNKILKIDGSEKFEQIKLPESLSSELVIKWLEQGLEKYFLTYNVQNTNDKKIFSENSYKHLTEIFCSSEQLAEVLNKEFAIITSLKTKYEELAPRLTLGSILRSEGTKEKAEYWLCVQAKCDSVRIGNKRVFPFLKLEKIIENKGFDFIVRDFNEFIQLKVDYSLYNTMHREFKAEKGIIKPIQVNEEYRFKESNGGKQFYWMGELRDNFSQRIINNLGSHLSRVGLDESEWLRRSAKI